VFRFFGRLYETPVCYKGLKNMAINERLRKHLLLSFSSKHLIMSFSVGVDIIIALTKPKLFNFQSGA